MKGPGRMAMLPSTQTASSTWIDCCAKRPLDPDIRQQGLANAITDRSSPAASQTLHEAGTRAAGQLSVCPARPESPSPSHNSATVRMLLWYVLLIDHLAMHRPRPLSHLTGCQGRFIKDEQEVLVAACVLSAEHGERSASQQ